MEKEVIVQLKTEKEEEEKINKVNMETEMKALQRGVKINRDKIEEEKVKE